MTVSSKDSRLVLLLSSLLIVIPMVIFPAKLGTDMNSGSFTYAMFEIVYYGVVLFIFRPGSSLLQLFQGIGLTFLYRIVIGTFFGISISVMYSVGFSAALTLGVSRYLPAIIFQIALAPIVTKPFFLAILGETPGDEMRRDRQKRIAVGTKKSTTTQPFQPIEAQRPSIVAESIKEDTTPAASPEKAANGFDRAVKYLSEHHAVKMAAVIDSEGLNTASFSRSGIEPEDLAPLALLFSEANRNILKRFTETPDPERLYLTFGQEKLFIIKVSRFMLLALSGREDDDLLGIRLAQAAEMISKYVSERYDRLMSASPEEKYVSST